MRLRRPLPAVQGDTLHIVGVGDNRIGKDYSTSSASKRTRFSSGTLPICLRDLSVARPTMFAVSTPASAIRPDRGTRSAVSWPKWSGTPANWFLASVSSSLICRALPSGWWRSIITVARRSSTSSKARTPSTGPVCHVASSATMPFGSSFTPWPTIWATSCGRWLCRRRWSTGR